MLIAMSRVSGVGAAIIASAMAMAAQSTSGESRFDVASVKVSGGAVRPGVSFKMKGGPGTSDPGRIVYTQKPLVQLLAKAWNIDMDLIAGPAWLKDPHGSGLIDVTATMPPTTTDTQLRTMLRNLLIERFNIRLHHEVRKVPGYKMIISAGGPKLRDSAKSDDAASAGGPTGKVDAQGFPILPPGRGAGIVMSGGVHARFQGYTVADLVASPYLSSFIAMSTGEGSIQIVDDTGLVGKYDFDLTFAAGDGVRGAVVRPGIRASQASPGDTLPPDSPLAGTTVSVNVFGAIEKQLGLKLVRVGAVPVDSLVIDHIERVPSEN